MRPIATTVAVSGKRLGLLRLADAVVDHVHLRRVDAHRDGPLRVRLGHGRDHVGGRVGGERESARQPRRDEALSGRGPAAGRGEVALAHVHAVLGEQDRRPVQRLVHERRHGCPAGTGDVQQIGLGRRGARGASHPVKSLVERRGLDRVELGRLRGAVAALVEHLLQRAQEAAPSRAGCETPAARRRGCAGTRPARRPKLRGRRPSRSASAPACSAGRRSPCRAGACAAARRSTRGRCSGGARRVPAPRTSGGRGHWPRRSGGPAS